MKSDLKGIDAMEVDNLIDMTSSDRLLSSILFIRPPGDNNAILIVEGNTDTKFYNSFVCKGEYVLQPDVFIDLIDANRGKKDKVIETIKKANEEGFKGIIGIIDADFDNLLEDICIVENLYRTDTHDLESLLLTSEKSLKKVLNRYYNVDHIIKDTDVLEIQNILLENSKYIGYALWCSNKYNWRINFKDFPIHICINDKYKCELDLKKTFNYLIKKSSNNTLSQETIESEVNQKVSEKWDLWQVCRGKEMLRVLATYIKYNLKKHACGPDNLRDDLILAFNEKDFMNTNLYASMKQWEQKNRYYSLIKC